MQLEGDDPGIVPREVALESQILASGGTPVRSIDDDGGHYVGHSDCIGALRGK
jgi:hypothetical protein